MRPALLVLPCCLLLSAPLAAQQPTAPAPPKLTMTRWSSATVNGSTDAEGKNALVLRSRNIVWLSNLGAKKPTAQIIARPQEGSSMGYAWISPDARHGAVMDDMRAMIIVALGPKPKALTPRMMISDAQFSPDGSAAWWWRREDPRDRDAHALKPRDAQILAPCTIYRMELGATPGEPVKTTLPQCRNILSTSQDGRYVIIGEGGQARRLSAYVDHADYYLDINTDSYARFYRVELATGARELVGDREILGVTISDDGRVICGSEPAAFFSEDEARVVCLSGGQAKEYKMRAAKDAKRGWRSVSVSPDGSKLALGLEAGPKQVSLVHVLRLADGALLRTEAMRASTLAWLPGGRRLFVTPDEAPAQLYDLEAGWSARVGEAGQEVSGLITLGQRDDRFLVGVERENTRDMWLVELSR